MREALFHVALPRHFITTAQHEDCSDPQPRAGSLLPLESWCCTCGRFPSQHRCSGRTSDTGGLVQLCNEVPKDSGSPGSCQVLGALSPAGSLWVRHCCEMGLVG